MQIVELTDTYIPAVLRLANQIHGDNYLSTDSLLQMQCQGIKQGINASFVAVEMSHVVGYRLSFAAGQWQPDKWCSKTLWPVPATQMAYFKSVGVTSHFRGQGVAAALLTASSSALRLQGATAGLAHVRRESPGNAAVLYFSKAGGTLVKVHPDRWRHLSETTGYLCPRCGVVCHCSAAEMVLSFTAI